jgi:hydrogenase expression/formation protein HypE
MDQDISTIEGAYCPVPLPHQEQIMLGHGSGGKMSHDLIERIFLPPFENPALSAGDDAGVAAIETQSESGAYSTGRISVSTDSHVVWPLFFPGGDIGRLAVCGTVNDVAMMGADPLYLTAGFILEEGLNIKTLEKVVLSMQKAATEAGIAIIAGDTKVVQRGKADGLYINTTGIGIIPNDIEISGANAQPGDLVILSGPIGAHGIAVLEARQELGFKSEITSDVAPLNHLVNAMLSASKKVHVLRDPTRGGLATTLNEIARQSQKCIRIRETDIPILPAVSMACEMLGFDPLYIANEGKLVAIVAKEDANQILNRMHNTVYGEGAVIIGEVEAEPVGRVLMQTSIGSNRIVDIPSGELLPRIC